MRHEQSVAAGQVVLERVSLGVGKQPGELVAGSVHAAWQVSGLMPAPSRVG
jgi:hypothetical protein